MTHIVLDDFLPQEQLEDILEATRSLYDFENSGFSCYIPKRVHCSPLNGKHTRTIETYCKRIREVTNIFNNRPVNMYEYWSHRDNPPNWHYDKDEALSNNQGIIRTPLCSTVFYPNVSKDVREGYFEVIEKPQTNVNDLTEDEERLHTKISPVTNRLIIFPSVYMHRGNKPKDGVGERLLLAVNLWDAEPAYPDNSEPEDK